MDSNATLPKIDVLLVGAGFGSFSLWKKLKDLPIPLTVKIYEKAPGSGGVWYWNCYPGARVDSPFPIYQIFSKDLYSTFNFKEKYPDREELRKYFKHIEKTWNIGPDIEYNKCVLGAYWIEEQHLWRVKCEDGGEVLCRWLVPCLGFGGSRYLPSFPGLENFRGKIFHTAAWPQEGVDLKGEKVAVIGTGASGVQVVQEIGEQVKHLTVYQRTPNFCVPMRQELLDPKEEEQKKQAGAYDKLFDMCRTTFAGLPYSPIPRYTFHATAPAERERLLQALWAEGGFRFWLGGYKDIFHDQEANDEIYRFWRTQVIKRVKNPKKAKLVAPETPPHPWGTKRPSLEQRYYEVIDQDQVDIIDVNASPIESVVPTGIITKEEGLVEVDIIVLATGFDTGASLSQINLVGVDGHTIAEHWGDGIKTSLGIAIPGFPNMFYIYGPHSPTAFVNGPSATNFQSEWIADTISNAIRSGWTWFEASQESEENWGNMLRQGWEGTLFPKAKSWYQGNNIPWRKVEPIFWCGGLPEYMQFLWESNENDYQKWIKARVDVETRN